MTFTEFEKRKKHYRNNRGPLIRFNYSSFLFNSIGIIQANMVDTDSIMTFIDNY